MALTKLNFYLSALFVFVVIPTLLGLTGLSLAANPNIILNERSEQYVIDLIANIEQQNVSTGTDNNNVELKETNLLTGDNETSEDFKDNFMAPLNFYRSKYGDITGTLRLSYNSPTFFWLALGLPLENISPVINAITLFLFISLLVLIIREVKG
jgi:hypothetical protein